MNEKIKEIVVNDEESYRLMLLIGGFIITIFYDDELIDPGQAILLKKRIEKENDEVLEVMCRCVSHNNDRLVLI